MQENKDPWDDFDFSTSPEDPIKSNKSVEDVF